MNSSRDDSASWIELNKEKNSIGEESKSEINEIKLKKDLTGDIIPPNIKNFSAISNISSFFSSKNSNIVCKIHKKDFLIVDTLKFKVHCSKCLEKGDKNKFLELTTDNLSSRDNNSNNSDYDLDNEDEIQCEKHPNSKGNFYCDDCQIFLCKLCFAGEHRQHKSNLPSDIAIDYKQNLKKLMENISHIKPKLEESLKSITEIDKKIKGIREVSLNRMKELVSKINLIVKSRYDNLVHQYELVYEGLDMEVENICKRLENLQKRSAKYIFDINEVINSINSQNMHSSIDICTYKKSKHELIKEINKILEDSKNFINYKIENTKSKVNAKIDNFNKQTSKLFKQIQIYEKSVMNSIHTGISSASLRLRRFSKFYKKLYEYYKTSSLVCKVSAPICLVGFGLTGLYFSMKDVKSGINPQGNTMNMATPAGGIPGKNSHVPIQIEILELKNEEFKKNEPLLSEIHNLLPIINATDPTLIIYLNKAINLKPDTKYMFTIINLHKDSYLELWCGETAKIFLKDLHQIIHCNTSKVNFEFFSSEGVESDFNEFNVGIIADLFFSSNGKKD